MNRSADGPVSVFIQPLPRCLPRKIDGQDVMAVMLGFDERTLERFREMRGNGKKVLVETSHRPALLYA
jgi:acyl-homoserine lactone synthase